MEMLNIFKGLSNIYVNTMLYSVEEINFNDFSLKGSIPIVIYNSLYTKPTNDIHLIHIESLINSKKMYVEIFSTDYYNKGCISSSHGKLNVLSFRCDINKKYFIKIILETVEENVSQRFMYYGFYFYEKTQINNSKNNISLTIEDKNNMESYSFCNERSIDDHISLDSIQPNQELDIDSFII